MTTALAKSDPILAKVDRARALLAEARDVPDAKKIADMARAAEVYARRQKLSKEAIDSAHAVMVDALALMGEFLKVVEKNTGAKGNPGGRGAKIVRSSNTTAQPKLNDFDLTKQESSDAQKLADIKARSPKLFEAIRDGETSIAKVRTKLKREKKRAELKVKAEAAQKAAAATDAPPSWEIIQGEAGGKNDPLLNLKPGSVRLVFCDPPYNIGVEYGEGHNDNIPRGEYAEWADTWIGRCIDLLTPDGSLWLLAPDEWVVAYLSSLASPQRLYIRNWVIWYETFGVNCSDKFNRTKRHLIYCAMNPKKYVFNADAVTRPSDRQTKYNDSRAASDGKLLDDVWFDIPRLVGTAAERVPDFPTQLPLALLRRIVACCSDPGDLVLDPCSGSATTGVAALELGRRYVGIERSAKFAKLSRLRLQGVNHAVGDGTETVRGDDGGGRVQRPASGDEDTDRAKLDHGSPDPGEGGVREVLRPHPEEGGKEAARRDDPATTGEHPQKWARRTKEKASPIPVTKPLGDLPLFRIEGFPDSVAHVLEKRDDAVKTLGDLEKHVTRNATTILANLPTEQVVYETITRLVGMDGLLATMARDAVMKHTRPGWMPPEEKKEMKPEPRKGK